MASWYLHGMLVVPGSSMQLLKREIWKSSPFSSRLEKLLRNTVPGIIEIDSSTTGLETTGEDDNSAITILKNEKYLLEQDYT